MNEVVQQTGRSYFEAEQIVASWQQTYEQARSKWQHTKQQATAQADAAEGWSKTALLAALGLGLGAAAAAIGGHRAAQHDTPVTETIAS